MMEGYLHSHQSLGNCRGTNVASFKNRSDRLASECKTQAKYGWSHSDNLSKHGGDYIVTVK